MKNKSDKKIPMTYALKDGKLLCVSEVSSGLSCGCICPSCNGKLVARKGNLKTHHFAHYNGEDCGKGYETSLHLLAKEIISESNVMMLPSLELHFWGETETLWNAKQVEIGWVEVEREMNGIIPDLLLHFGTEDKILAVEIYVTHKTDEEKIAKLKEKNLSAIEIDLSKYDHPVSKEELKELLLNTSERKYWIYNNIREKLSEYYEKCMEQFIEKKNVIVRGYALHVDYCHVRSRVYKGKPYANVMDDCPSCQYCYFIDSDDLADEDGFIYHSGPVCVYCSAKSGITCLADLKERMKRLQSSFGNEEAPWKI